MDYARNCRMKHQYVIDARRREKANPPSPISGISKDASNVLYGDARPNDSTKTYEDGE